MRVLVANVGSTSFKYKLLEMEGERALAWGRVERIGSAASPIQHQALGRQPFVGEMAAPDQASAVKRVLALLTDPVLGCLASLAEVAAVGFKTVHAGALTGAVPVTDRVLAAMASFNDVAPAHNPPYLAAMAVFRQAAPALPQVAVFETAFHATMPDYAFVYSVPYEWYETYGLRRYGFHSASFRYVVQRAPELLGRPVQDLRLVACHLGGSSSICAIREGRSIDTSMGFTPQAGLPMGTRCGDIDPFIVPFIMDREKLTTDGLRQVLTTRGGLLGISGLSADVRDLEAAAVRGHARAALALASYAYQVKKYIGAYAAALGGLDALVFSGGIGENAAAMRARICEGLGFLGMALDPRRNDSCVGKEGIISAEPSAVTVLVIPTDEEIIVARETVRVVTAALPRPA